MDRRTYEESTWFREPWEEPEEFKEWVQEIAEGTDKRILVREAWRLRRRIARDPAVIVTTPTQIAALWLAANDPKFDGYAGGEFVYLVGRKGRGEDWVMIAGVTLQDVLGVARRWMR